MVKILEETPKEPIHIIPHINVMDWIMKYYTRNFCPKCQKRVSPKFIDDKIKKQDGNTEVIIHTNPRLVCPYCGTTLAYLTHTIIEIDNDKPKAIIKVSM